MSTPATKKLLTGTKNVFRMEKVSKEIFKREAVKFFNLSQENSTKSKQIFKKEIDNFITMHKNTQRKLMRDLFEEKGGSGRNYEIPPTNFMEEVTDEKERRKSFTKIVCEEIKLSKQYQDWLGQNCCLLPAACCLITGKITGEKKDLAEGSNNQINLVRERSSGRNIFDAEKTVITNCEDGTTKKSVIKETYAKITIRKKRNQTDNENGKGNGISGSGEIKRAKAVDNILNHATEHDKGTKAALVAKIIDKEGSLFGQDILKKSKVMQETRQLNAEKTAGLITGVRGSEYLFRQIRTGLNNELGYSPLASQRKVEAFREKTSAKSGKDFGSITGTNLFPLENIFRYLPPLMHIIMGLANDVLKELKKDVIKCDDEEKPNEGFDDHHNKVQENLLKMYSEVEDLEAQLSNTSLSKMVIQNDLKRVALLKKDLMEEAEKVSKENYRKQKATKKNERQSCGAASCLLFTIDVENDWDQMLTCKNTCKVHLRCEGIALVDEDEELPDGYTCVQCQKNKPNDEWIEDAFKTKNQEFTKSQMSLNLRITSVKADIAHNEHLEETESGPRQRQLKNAMKKLGDIARYHGGDLQGKQVQKLLDDARDETFEIIDCVKDHKNLHTKYSTALTCLANVSDALKTSGEDHEDEGVKIFHLGLLASVLKRGSFLICFCLGHYLLNTRSICLNHSDHSCGKSRLFPGLFAHFPNLVSLL